MYLERLDKPVLNSEYYVPAGTENDMPNCTKYCHDRAQEACEKTDLRLFKDIDVKGFPMADTWIQHSILPTGKDLRTGSIACFSGTNGSIHVAFVERVNEDGTCLISDSRFDEDKTLRNDRFWRFVDKVVLKIGQIPGGIPGVGELLGFQYLPIKDIRAERDTEKSQIVVFDTGLRCRTNYGKDAPIVNEGCYVPVGIYDVLETAEADGYTWCKVEEGHWIAHDPSWANLYLKKEEPSEPTGDDFEESVNAFVRRMRAEHNNNVAIMQGLSDISAIIDRLKKL